MACHLAYQRRPALTEAITGSCGQMALSCPRYEHTLVAAKPQSYPFDEMCRASPERSGVAAVGAASAPAIRNREEPGLDLGKKTADRVIR
jgi:hypothetical protein